MMRHAVCDEILITLTLNNQQAGMCTYSTGSLASRLIVWNHCQYLVLFLILTEKFCPVRRQRLCIKHNDNFKIKTLSCRLQIHFTLYIYNFNE